MKQKRNHRVTISITVSGDIDRTLRTETLDMTETEFERFCRCAVRGKGNAFLLMQGVRQDIWLAEAVEAEANDDPSKWQFGGCTAGWEVPLVLKKSTA